MKSQGAPMGRSKEDNILLRHPFTMMVSGPTSCGKTYMVAQLLRVQRISPAPQRIIWLYKRWQPLYDVIAKTVIPKVEFVKGIPFDLEEDGYLNPRDNNVIVLDDLMSSSAKDSRITDLFTEGSHHRNLSVVAINQNLYYAKDPTQRRNSHYLVLFNNPIDQQLVVTFARQMYPDNVAYFMHHFKEATSRPHGHLLIDLKPDTPNNMRLRSNVLVADDRSQILEREAPMEQDTPKTADLKPDTPNNVPDDQPPILEREVPMEQDTHKSVESNTQRGEGYSEDGTVVSRHKSSASCSKCPEWRVDETPESSIWRKLFMPQVKEDAKEEMTSLIHRRMHEGESVSKANANAYNEYLPMLRKRLLRQFLDFMLKVKSLERDPVTRQILSTAQKLRIEYALSEEEALKKAAEFRSYLLDDILPVRVTMDVEEEEEASDTDYIYSDEN